jgi:hypothetical protein
MVGKPDHPAEGVVGKPDYGSLVYQNGSASGVVGKPDLQKTDIQHTVKQQTDVTSKTSTMKQRSDDVDNSANPGELTPLQAVISQKIRRDTESKDELEAAADHASRELNNWRVYRSNRTQARNIAEEYKVSDTMMAQIIYQALARTKQEDPRLPMPYLFKTARQLLEDRAAKHATLDLAGKYAPNIMR